MKKMNIGQNIKKLRISKGLTQTELAKLVGKETASYVSLVESGKRLLNTKTLLKLCLVFRLSPNKIIGWDGP